MQRRQLCLNPEPAGILRLAGCRAVSLVELIGVLAIVVILASLAYSLAPRFLGREGGPQTAVQAVSEAALAETQANLNAIKTAVLQHCARFRSPASNQGQPLAFSGSYEQYDRILMAEGLLEKPFHSRIGTGAVIRIVDVSAAAAGAYDLGGDGRNALAGASYLVEAVLGGVSAAEAKALNDRLDGPALGAPAEGGSDRRGRVIHDEPQPGLPLQVRIYLAHF